MTEPKGTWRVRPLDESRAAGRETQIVRPAASTSEPDPFDKLAKPAQLRDMGALTEANP